MEVWEPDPGHDEGGRWIPVSGTGGGGYERPGSVGFDVRVEVFMIIEANEEQGTFQYTNAEGTVSTGEIDHDGYFEFELERGRYEMNNNYVEAYVNDSLHRTKASGGLKEINPTRIGIELDTINDLDPEEDTKITIKYFYFK